MNGSNLTVAVVAEAGNLLLLAERRLELQSSAGGWLSTLPLECDNSGVSRWRNFVQQCTQDDSAMGAATSICRLEVDGEFVQ